ncbi:hypothetical protein ACFE04_029065 [Oxalis oulophora]
MAAQFFAEAGFPYPQRRNSSDHFLRCINSDFDRGSKANRNFYLSVPREALLDVESGDHIMPFRDENNGDYHPKQSQWCQQGSTTVKPGEQRNPEAKGETHGHGKKPKGGSLSFDETTITSSPQVSLSNNPAKNDQEDSHNLHHSSSVETTELDKGLENFQNALEDKEQGHFALCSMKPNCMAHNAYVCSPKNLIERNVEGSRLSEGAWQRFSSQTSNRAIMMSRRSRSRQSYSNQKAVDDEGRLRDSPPIGPEISLEGFLLFQGE